MKDPELAKQWLEAARHVGNIEMELGGVYQAARYGGTQDYRVLAVRGIRSGFKTSFLPSTAAFLRGIRCPCYRHVGFETASSDIVGYRRRHEWTDYACRSAAAFAYALIRSGVIEVVEA